MPSTPSPASPPPPLPEPPQPPEHPRTLFLGHWVGPMRAGVRVLEFEVKDAPLDWHPGANAVLDLIHGTPRDVPVEIKESTLVGIIKPGCLIHLALRIDDLTSNDVTAVLLTTAGRVIRIAI